MDTYKLKIRIGDAEFEAEGPVETVQAQFEAFKEMMTVTPVKPHEPSQEPGQVRTAEPMALDKIMKVDGRLVALTAHSNREVDQAVLLVMLGQKTFRTNDAVTGGEIIDGLKESGHVVSRIGGVLDKLASQGHVIKVGVGKASRYRLTTKGFARAQEIAREVLALVA